MKSIVVATDFSERSDRAIRRAKLLARESDAKLHLVHVVDDDQAQALVRVQLHASTTLLEELTSTLEHIDGVKCDFRVVLGKTFLGITQAAQDVGADVIIIGPYRRQLLRGILVGTTGERTIRTAGCPVLMANGVPTGPYRRTLVATDLSPYSERTFRHARSLGLLDGQDVSLLHVYTPAGTALFNHAALNDFQKETYLMGERMRASEAVVSFIKKVKFDGLSTILKPANVDVAETICATADELPAELIVMGTCNRSVLERVLIGSVTEGVLRNSERDVLAIPPQQDDAPA